MSNGTKDDNGKPLAALMYLEGLGYIGRLIEYLLVMLRSRDSDAAIRRQCDLIIESSLSMINTTVEDSIESITRIYILGAKKYGANNYKAGLGCWRMINAMARHYIKRKWSDHYDRESGEDHYYHIIANALMIKTVFETDNDVPEKMKEFGFKETD